jgi:ribosome-associated toxin RatA of RatAB toxin-antitoxin module
VAEKTAQTIYIDAEPATVMDVIADIGSYPDWVSEYKEAEVLEADANGYPKVARLVLDTSVLKDTLVLSYDWPKDHESVRWKLVSIWHQRHIRAHRRLGHPDDRVVEA